MANEMSLYFFISHDLSAKWIVDSRGNRHMTRNLALLHKYQSEN